MITGADLYGPAQSTLANRRAINANVKLIRDAIKKPQRRGRKTIKTQQLSRALIQWLYRLRKSVREIQIQTAFYDALRRWHIHQPIVVGLDFVRGLLVLLVRCGLRLDGRVGCRLWGFDSRPCLGSGVHPQTLAIDLYNGHTGIMFIKDYIKFLLRRIDHDQLAEHVFMSAAANY